MAVTMAVCVTVTMTMAVSVTVAVTVPNHDTAHAMNVEAVMDVTANDPRAVMIMERLAGSRIADDERERSRCREQRFPEHDVLGLGDVGRWLRSPWRPCS